MDTGEVKEAVGDTVMELLDVEPPYGELEKGVPLISFACKQGEGDAVLVKALPLPEADAWLGREKAASGEALYRVDYLARGNRVYATGVLPAGCGRGSFLERLGEAVERGDRKAGEEPLCRLLGMHLALCGLEALAGQERALLEKGLPLGGEAGDGGEEGCYRQADYAYYGEVLSFVEKGRELLNRCSFPEAVRRLPAFPDKGSFMRKWYGKDGGKEGWKDESRPDRRGRAPVAEPVPDEAVGLP